MNLQRAQNESLELHAIFFLCAKFHVFSLGNISLLILFLLYESPSLCDTSGLCMLPVSEPSSCTQMMGEWMRQPEIFMNGNLET